MKAILSNSTRKLLRFEITEMLIAVKNKFIVHSFISPQDVIAKKQN